MDVQLPNGTIMRGVPEGTSKDEIMRKAVMAGLATEQDFMPMQEPRFPKQEAALQAQQFRQQALEDLAKEQGPIQSGLIATGRAFTDLGRAVGLVDPATELENQAFAALEKESPISTGVGYALPYVAASVPAGGLSLAPRVATMGGLGGAELGIKSAQKGDDIDETVSQAAKGGAIAAGIELALPYVGKLVGSIYRGLTGRTVQNVFDEAGNVIPEVQKVLDANNINVDEIKGTAVKLAQNQPLNEQEAARMSQFQELGVPFTPGDISGEFGQRAKEARLLEVQDEPLADQLRNIRTSQAEAIDTLKTDLAKNLGDETVAGENVKAALKEAESLARTDRKAAYDLLAEKAGASGGIPIPQDKLLETIYDDSSFIGMLDGLTGAERTQLSDLMVKYGIDTNQDAIEDFTSRNAGKGIFSRGNQITPLTTSNAEDLSKALNSIAGPTSSPALKGVVSKIKSGVDNGFDLIDQSLFNTADLVAAKDAARQSHIDLMQQFGEGGIVNKLIKTKRDGVSQAVEASNVFNNLFKPGRTNTIEQVEKVTEQLSKTAGGKRALGDLQAAFVLDVLDKGFTVSDKLNGQMLFQGGQATNRLNQLGRKEAEILFKNNPQALKKLDDILEVGLNITPSKKEVLKGSAGLITNVVRPVADAMATAKFNLPAGLLNGMDKLSQAGADKKALEKLLKSQPALVKQSKFIRRDLPAIATLLGLTQLEEDEID